MKSKSIKRERIANRIRLGVERRKDVYAKE